MTSSVKRHPYLVACAAWAGAMLPLLLMTGALPWAKNDYNSYTLQALAWLDGRLDIADGEWRTWLELAILDGKYYVSFPPFPSVVLLPFAALMGEQTPEGWIALALGFGSVCLAVRLCRLLGLSEARSVLWGLFAVLANGYAFLTMNGWVWYIAQNLCFFLSLAALCCAEEGHACRALTLLCCAAGCRPMALLWLPVMLEPILRRWYGEGQDIGKMLLRLVKNAIPAILLGCGYMALNKARFGSVTEFGHNYLPEFSTEGGVQFSLAHVPGNFAELIALPRWDETARRLRFSKFGSGMCYLLNPVLTVAAFAWLVSIRRDRREDEYLRLMVPLCAAAHFFIICCHRTLGAWQFGNRYLVDMVPWLLWAALRWSGDNPRAERLMIGLFALGASVNWLGTALLYLDIL